MGSYTTMVPLLAKTELLSCCITEAKEGVTRLLSVLVPAALSLSLELELRCLLERREGGESERRGEGSLGDAAVRRCAGIFSVAER